MKIISVICQKGGTGKTTLALNIAVAAMEQGLAVAIIDLDPQPSACAWADLRAEKNNPPVIDAKPARLAAAIDTARTQGGIDLLIIDTGGRTEEGAFAAAKASDLIILPLQPSAIDLKSVPATRDLIAIAGGAPVLSVLTRVKPFGTRHDEARDWLAANKVPVSPISIGDRVTFQDAYASGMAVTEYDPSSRAAEEVMQLTDSVLRQLGIKTSGHADNHTCGDVDNGHQTTKSRRAR